MNELIRRLTGRPIVTAELTAATLFANLLALASPLFVMQVLNRYVTYGVDATLATLTIGVLGAIGLEYAFRQARYLLISHDLGLTDRNRAIGAFGREAHRIQARLQAVAEQRAQLLQRFWGIPDHVHALAVFLPIRPPVLPGLRLRTAPFVKVRCLIAVGSDDRLDCEAPMQPA